MFEYNDKDREYLIKLAEDIYQDYNESYYMKQLARIAHAELISMRKDAQRKREDKGEEI